MLKTARRPLHWNRVLGETAMKNTLAICAAFVCVVLGARAQTEAKAFDPDLVVLNANVITVNDSHPRAEAFAVKNNRFIAVGSNVHPCRKKKEIHP